MNYSPEYQTAAIKELMDIVSERMKVITLAKEEINELMSLIESLRAGKKYSAPENRFWF